MVSIPEFSIYSLLVNTRTNPSPNPTLTLSSQLGHNVWLGEVWVSSCPDSVHSLLNTHFSLRNLPSVNDSLVPGRGSIPYFPPPPPPRFFLFPYGFGVKLHRFHCFLQSDSRTYKHVTMLNMQTNTRRICWSRTSLTCGIDFRVMKDSYFLQRRREKRLNKLLARPQNGWTTRAGTRLLT